ncbi:DNA (cytosine-5)-methyltransferase DRM2 isoform X1 [Tripterygium wilfordii]|uniref:DNA (Cytosine-5)-methyltransferase DRM2 isoform X1 n=1 Tax=Tripterygium wilfordii TaxID=458696 RepID=A0A7J7CSN5_TRIWF|nr:probable inactive DNA (cytosine-5)-methyltransferase DRM3 isoform X2 [Tripterygium wilfordii]KAF5737100.1 DNA (cytosine-5)-methyltransferase DRM2 isoform X1 [Tripterygium wilfordii]
MGEDTKNSNGEGSSARGDSKALVPKAENLDLEMPSETTHSRPHGDSVPSLPEKSIRDAFIGMGFSPSLVDQTMKEIGDENADLLLDTLMASSGLQSSSSESSDSLDSLFDDEDSSGPPQFSSGVLRKEEPDVVSVNDYKRESLLSMNFSVNEVNFAMDKHGQDASISDLVDFITANQIAVKQERETDDMPPHVAVNNEDCNDESLFGTMEKTLRLLEMGFSENEVSLAIERLGSEATIQQLAGSICGDPIGGHNLGKAKLSSMVSSSSHSQFAKNHASFGMRDEAGRRRTTYDPFKIKTENISLDTVSNSTTIISSETYKGKRPKEECRDDFPATVYQFRHKSHFEENEGGKRPKQEYGNDSGYYVEPTWLEEKVDPTITRFGTPNVFKSKPCRSLDHVVANPPYFFYGDIVNVSDNVWTKVSKFLYAIEPEFVNAQFFSAVCREEGYIHNLPTENRLHILPKPPMTIQEAMPHTKKWWPSWDVRKHVSCINSEMNGIPQLCDRLGKILSNSQGMPSPEQLRDILRHCQKSNLVWIGPYKLGPLDPEHLERILGYPANHTQSPESSLTERLESLRYCFQTDTLGYHLSVLKSMFPEGLTILSLFSGIGGAEVSLYRLGIHLKGVVSVETSEAKRRVLRRWWHSSGQTGQLEQIEEIQKLTASKIETLFEKFGGFDFIICQNPCTLSAKSSKVEPRAGNMPGYDSSIFYETLFFEFVRVLQRVRGMMGRRR